MPDHELVTRLREAALARRVGDWRLGQLLLAAEQRGLHHRLGHAHVVAFAEAELSLAPRVTHALLAVARKAAEWPELHEALEAGELTYTKARELLRVAVEGTVGAWVQRACAVSSRALEAEVTAAHVGDLPPVDGAARRGPARRRITLVDVEATDAEAIEALITAVQNQAGLKDHEVDRGHVLADACRLALQRLQAEDDDGPTGDRHVIVLHQDAQSGVITGEHDEVSEQIVGQACCDHVVVDLRPGPARGTARHAIPPRVARAVRLRDGRRCTVPGCTNRLYVDLHHLTFSSRGGDHSEHNLICLCSTHHRLVHAGDMGAERLPDGTLRFSFRDRILLRPPAALDLPPDGRTHGQSAVRGPGNPGALWEASGWS